MRYIVLFILLMLCPCEVRAIEPIFAFDDAFLTPRPGSGPETVYAFPGGELMQKGVFLAGGWSVPFGMDDLAVSTGMAGYGVERFGLFASYTGTGFDLYGDEQEKIGAAFSLVKNVAIGARLTRTAMRIKGFGDDAAIGCDAGLVAHPLSSLSLAAAFEDVTGTELGDSCEPIDGRLRLAASWNIHDYASLIAGATKVRRFDMSSTCGIIVMTGNRLTLGCAGGTEPDRMEFLCGVSFGGSMASYRGSYTRYLGMTHGFSLSLRENAGGNNRE